MAAAGRRFGGCWGPNKKQAEQQAALTALLDLELASADAAGDIHLAEACWNDGAIPHVILHAATSGIKEPVTNGDATPAEVGTRSSADVDGVVEATSPEDAEPSRSDAAVVREVEGGLEASAD